jgi:hypothetical protein
MIVLASLKTQTEANALLAKLPTVDFLPWAPAYPRVVDTAVVDGLRPGYQALVAGVCASKTQAQQVRDALELATGIAGTVRKVRATDADTGCPSFIPAQPSTLPVVERAPVDERFPGIQWVLRKKDVNAQCSHYAVGVEIGRTTVYQATHKETGCGKNSINTTRFEVGLAKVGKVAYARLGERMDWEDNGTRSENLLGLSCTGVHPVLELGNQYDTALDIAPAGDGSGRTRLRVVWKRGECGNCEPSGPVEYTRTADGCTFERAK